MADDRVEAKGYAATGADHAFMAINDFGAYRVEKRKSTAVDVLRQ
jgi:hypothetical protein